MLHASAQSVDPLRPTLALTGLFALLCGIRLTLPSITFFDEVHYVPAAKALLEGTSYINREHPLLGKHMVSLGIMIFGDNAFGWRVMPYLAGVLAFFAMMRAFWLATLSRFASIMFGFLIITGFMLLVHARLAMLDIFMVAALSVAGWQFAGSLREPETAHRRLLCAGIALGAAMASKWNAIPLAMVPGIAFFVGCLMARSKAGDGFFAKVEDVFVAKRALPIPGVSLVQAAFYLGVVPLAVYAATFVPSLLYSDSPLAEVGLIALHIEMLDLQSQVLQPHPYQSHWGEWLFNLRGIWYLHEFVDEAQRGVLLIGNPASMLLGLPALIWCGYDGFKRRDPAKIAVVIGFAVSLGLWLIAPKSVQFYYHYLVPSIFLMAALALALEDLFDSETDVVFPIGFLSIILISKFFISSWSHYILGFLPIMVLIAVCTVKFPKSAKERNKLLVCETLAAIGLMFAYFYPILTAAQLTDAETFRYYAWIAGWI